MSMPVQSKGVFADAYKSVGQGKGPGQRPQPKMSTGGNSGTTFTRVVQAAKRLTAIGMRKPFG